MDQGPRMVNVGTAERPVLVPEEQVTNPSSEFWNGIVDGNTKVGGTDGIDLDRSLKVAGIGGEKTTSQT